MSFCWSGATFPSRIPRTHPGRRGVGRRSGDPFDRLLGGQRHTSLKPLTVKYGRAVIYEHALLSVRPGRQEEFITAFETAREIISAMGGFQSLSLSTCVERPDTYLLLVRWATLGTTSSGSASPLSTCSGVSCCIASTSLSQSWSTSCRSSRYDVARPDSSLAFIIFARLDPQVAITMPSSTS